MAMPSPRALAFFQGPKASLQPRRVLCCNELTFVFQSRTGIGHEQ